MIDNAYSSSTDEYIPTLGEYAEIIEWLANDNGPMPLRMRRAYIDALERAAMRRFAHSMADAEDAARYVWYGYDLDYSPKDG